MRERSRISSPIHTFSFTRTTFDGWWEAGVQANLTRVSDKARPKPKVKLHGVRPKAMPPPPPRRHEDPLTFEALEEVPEVLVDSRMVNVTSEDESEYGECLVSSRCMPHGLDRDVDVLYMTVRVKDLQMVMILCT